MLSPVVGGCLNCSTELIPMPHTCKPDGDQLCSYLFSKILFFMYDHPTVTYVLCYFLSGHNVCTRLHEGHNVCTHTHISMMYMKFTRITSFMNMVNTIVIIMIVVVHSMLWTTTAFMQLFFARRERCKGHLHSHHRYRRFMLCLRFARRTLHS